MRPLRRCESPLNSKDKPSALAASPTDVCETTLRVRYAETDRMGVVYHSNYIIWFEVGRVEMFRHLGFTYSEMEKRDRIRVAVVEVSCRFKSPALYDELITIRTCVRNARKSLLHFGYEVVRSTDGTILAEGETIHLVVDPDFKRIALPERYLTPFLRATGKT
jgi:acyl-CoA thioester hydrolase